MLNKLQRFKKRNEFYLLLVLIGLSIILTSVNRDFFTLENFLDLIVSYSFLGIMAAGVLVVLISGGIDISFTATATVAEYVMAILIISYGGSLIIAMLITCIIGMMLGAVNAILVHNLKVPAIIITVGTLNIFHGMLIFLSKGKWIYNFPVWFYQVNLFNFNIGNKSYSFTNSMLILLLVIVLTWFILNKTSIGRKTYAMGGNREAAGRAGFSLFKLHLFAYCYMGFLAGVAAFVHAQTMQTIAPNAIVGRELEVLAAVVLGGASLAGGKGTLFGTVLGVALLAIMQNGLIMMGVSSYWHNVFIGLVIIISVSITAYQQTAKKANQGRRIEI